jgi:hypothetical protein
MELQEERQRRVGGVRRSPATRERFVANADRCGLDGEGVFVATLTAEVEQRGVVIAIRERKVPDRLPKQLLEIHPALMQFPPRGFARQSCQMRVNLLKTTGLKIGMLTNFGRDKVEYRRFIF